MAEICERCGNPTTGPSNRYCQPCKKLVLKELSDSGYLQKTQWGHPYRSAEQKENTRETWYGKDQG